MSSDCDPGLEVGLHLVLVAGVGVHDVPVAGAGAQRAAQLLDRVFLLDLALLGAVSRAPWPRWRPRPRRPRPLRRPSASGSTSTALGGLVDLSRSAASSTSTAPAASSSSATRADLGGRRVRRCWRTRPSATSAASASSAPSARGARRCRLVLVGAIRRSRPARRSRRARLALRRGGRALVVGHGSLFLDVREQSQRAAARGSAEHPGTSLAKPMSSPATSATMTDTKTITTRCRSPAPCGGRPDDLAQLGDDLAEEPGEPGAGTTARARSAPWATSVRVGRHDASVLVGCCSRGSPSVEVRACRPRRGSGAADVRRGDRTRTCNLRFWRPVLCQLSYAPRTQRHRRRWRGGHHSAQCGRKAPMDPRLECTGPRRRAPTRSRRPFSSRRIHLPRSAYRQHLRQRRRDRLHSGVAGRERLRTAISSKITVGTEQDRTLDRTRSTLASERPGPRERARKHTARSATMDAWEHGSRTASAPSPSRRRWPSTPRPRRSRRPAGR